MNICLIATFDHNSGTTACGLELDTYTIKYPELTGALQYGYAKGSGPEIKEVTCAICLSTELFKEESDNWDKYINQNPQDIIELYDRLKIKYLGCADTIEGIKQSTLDNIRKYK